jgi:uncharacterized protein (TIGR00369 family)
MARVSEGALARARAALAGDPFAALLGIVMEEGGEDALECVLPMRAHVVGNPHLRAVHGGALAALIETAGIVLLAARGVAVARVADSTVDYLRPAVGEAFRARAQAVRLGRRVANVAVRVWSDAPERPVAAGHVNYLLRAP